MLSHKQSVVQLDLQHVQLTQTFAIVYSPPCQFKAKLTVLYEDSVQSTCVSYCSLYVYSMITFE